MGFRHKVYQSEKLIRNGLMVLEPVATAGHIDDLAAVDETVKDGGGDSSVAKEVGPLVKALVGGDDEGGLFAHGRDTAKEQVGLGGGEGHEAYLVHHHKGCSMEEL